MADNSLPKVVETALPAAAMENVTHFRVVSTDNSEKLPKSDLTIAGTKVTVAVDGLSGTVDGAFGDVLTAIAEKADTTQVEALDDELVQVRSDLTELEQEQIQGGVYDVSSHNDGAVFESLSSLLNHANLSTLIPTSVRCGGMSIRFIQGSGNNYVQYRLKKDNFSVVLSDWEKFNEEQNILGVTGKYNVNNVILTSDEISVGTVIEYKFDVQTQIGYIDLYDSSDVIIERYGKTSSSTAFGTYSGCFSVPEGFSYAKIYANGDKSYFDVVYLKKKNSIIVKPYDNASLQSYINNFDEIILEEGTYNIPSYLTIPSGFKISGVRGKTILKLTGSTSQIMYIGGSENVTIENITFEGDGAVAPSAVTLADIKANTSAGTKSGIYISSYSKTVHINNCEFKNFSYAGIRSERTFTDFKKGLKITDCLFNYNYFGIYFGVRTEYNTVIGCTMAYNQIGLYNSGGNNNFTCCHFDANSVGVELNGTSPAENDNHGVISASSLNHNLTFGIASIDVNYGFLFVGCNNLGSAKSLIVSNSKGVTLDSCVIDSAIEVDSPRDNALNIIQNSVFVNALNVVGNFDKSIKLVNNRYRDDSDNSFLNNEHNVPLEDVGILVLNEKVGANKLLFDDTQVEIGEKIYYSFQTTGINTGVIDLYNSSDEVIASYGKISSGGSSETRTGNFVVPEDFSYAKVSTTFSSINVFYLKTEKNNKYLSNIVSELYKAMGILVDSGNYAINTILFRSTDVLIGDTINYKLNVQTQIGRIDLYDSSDALIASYGKISSSTTFGIYKGAFVIPERFSYAKVYAAGDKGNYDIEYLVDFTLCNSQINATNSRVAALESGQTKVKGAQDDFIKQMGYICYKETYNANTTLFTSDNVLPGNLLRYDLYAHSSTGLGTVDLYNAENIKIGNFGKKSSGATGQDFNGIFEVPVGFSYAKTTGSDKITVTISCNDFEQKQDIVSGKRVMLKDRLTYYGASGKYYVSFSSGVVFNGKEVHVSRVSQSHYSDYSDGVFVFQEITESGEIRDIYPDLGYANLTGYVRDPNIVVIGDYLVLTTAMSDPQTRANVANYIFILDADYNVVYSTELGVDGYTFGNTLLTPDGKLLRCTYASAEGGGVNSIKIWRSNETFNTLELTFTLVNTLSHETTNLYEPNIGYVKDKLVLIARTSSLGTGLICASAGLQGNGDFGAWKPLGVNLHAATIEPYNNDYKVLIAGGEYDASYKRPPVVIKWDVENSLLLEKGVVDNDMTVSGSYPSFVNVGGDTYAMVYYEDYNNTAVYTYLYYRRVNIKYLFNH